MIEREDAANNLADNIRLVDLRLRDVIHSRTASFASVKVSRWDASRPSLDAGWVAPAAGSCITGLSSFAAPSFSWTAPSICAFPNWPKVPISKQLSKTSIYTNARTAPATRIRQKCQSIKNEKMYVSCRKRHVALTAIYRQRTSISSADPEQLTALGVFENFLTSVKLSRK